MRLQVEVITTQVNQLAEQVCQTKGCAQQALLCCPALATAVSHTVYIPSSASMLCQLMQAQQLQQQLHQQPPAISHKFALQLGEALTQKLIQLDNVQVTGMDHITANACTYVSQESRYACAISE